jgi:hypothetical protein
MGVGDIGQNRAMSRRNHATRGSGRGRPQARPFSLGSHWRSDGGPKTVFRSQQEALRAANVSQIESGTVLHAYVCDFCSQWHLGNAAGRER